MQVFDIAAILLTLAAVFGWVNYKFIKLPTTIGIMVVSLVVAGGLVVVGEFRPAWTDDVEAFVVGVEFDKTLLNVMLSYLLFAGAMQVNLGDLAEQRRVIAILATVGVVISTFLIGTVMYFLLPVFGLDVSYIYCLLFGALISPTDPVAVLGIMKKAGAPKTLETKICGESLFNDGVGVVVFLALFGILEAGGQVSLGDIGHLFLVEAVGGVLFGFGLGTVGYYMLKKIDDYQVEILITLALVTGGYALARQLHTSGPLAMVVTGLMIGNHGRSFAMSKKTEEHLDTFWELIDEILNALLFVLIGLELLVIELEGRFLLIGVIAIVLVLAARMVAVSIPVTLLKRVREFSPGVVWILTWGGLRGGISVALALSLPRGEERDLFLTVTYVVVVFSILVQGLTLKRLFVPAGGKQV